MPTPVVALTIAGVDSSGGAGLHADIRTFAALGVHGASAVAALTAQSTRGIDAVHLVDPPFVAAQATSVLDDLDVRATKTGFLGSAGTVEAVGRLAAAGRLPNLVVDPVLVRSDGRPMFPSEVDAAYAEHLLAPARVLTPNRVEAGVLVGRELRSVPDMASAACELSRRGPDVVVVTGGRAGDEGGRSIDVVAAAGAVVAELTAARVRTGNDHGSGCTLSAAIAARLALGDDPVDAIRSAKAFVHAGLEGAAGWRIGAGHGPLDQMGWTAGVTGGIDQ